ncbi:FUSC family protein [Actinomycetospora sp. OC33-EN08]|uniref:FUSC family protein n=1 Tax=Actinomycetospora aurantiaca TaxID=3129233 RepID=A0ABU8MLJ6_9PSEU
MLGLFVVLVVPAFALGLLFGAGPAAIVGAFAGLFSFIGVAGGPLWSDLRALAVSSPLLLVAACGPRLLAEWSRPAAFVLILAIVLVAGLLPLRRPGLTTLGLGLGLLTLISYGLPIGGGIPALQLVVATVAGLVVAALFRCVTGLRDPHGPARAKVAGLLDEPEPSVAGAVDLWLRDGRPTWLAAVITAAVRTRLALATADATVRRLPVEDRAAGDRAVEAVRERARSLAAAVRATRPSDEPPGRTTPVPELEDPVHAADDALDRVAELVVRRDRTPLADDDRAHHGLRSALASTDAWRSTQVRHAFRTTLGVLLVLLVSLALRPGDPLLPTLLMTTFSILQTSWDATLARARPKILGLLAGAAVAVAIILVLPKASLLPIALVALVLGLATITSRPTLGSAAMVCVSVGFSSSLRGLDPVDVLVEYGILMVVAVLVSVVVAFAVVPSRRRPDLRRRLEAAVAATAAALDALAEDSPDRTRAASAWRDAARARRDLVGEHDRLSDHQTEQLERIRLGLDDLALLATLRGPDDGAASLVEARHRLETDVPGAPSGVLPALADEVRTDRRDLESACP